MSPRARRTVVWALAAVAAVALYAISRSVCITTWWRHRVVLPQCPDGALRQTVSIAAHGLRRGAPGAVTVEATARYTVGDADDARAAPVRSFEVELALVDAADKATPLAPGKDGWRRGRAEIVLPDVPDGDYRLRARVRSRLGEDRAEVPLALYAPARVHVLTDRPLYEPGNTVKLRAVVLRARDLAPLDGRPGRWVVTDPSGEVLLEEKAPAGPWGVVSGSFPLDTGAAHGTWSATWVSADASDTLGFTVEPFTLPRFRVEAVADRPFYRAGDRPVVRVAATYSSGAPVAGGQATIAWSVEGDWPAPTEWLDPGAAAALPAAATTGPTGRLELRLPPIPADLVGQATLVGRVAVTDAAGDRVEGAVRALLSKDAIQASAVTELEDGLVDGFNNRLFVRVTTADGRPLGGAKIRVTRAWAAERDPGIEAALDEDGVGALQIDPGPAVNVVIDPPPARPPPKRRLVTRGATRELLGDEGVPLADQRALDQCLPALEPCAKWVAEDAEDVVTGLRVDERGEVVSAVSGGGALGACATAALRGRRLGAGAPRVYAVAWTFHEPDVARLEVTVDEAIELPEAVEERLALAARGARDCLGAQTAEGELARALAFRVTRGRRELELSWVRDPAAEDAVASPCVEARLAGVSLDEPAKADGLGLARFSIVLPERLSPDPPQPTVMQGYELVVTAATDGNPSTLLRLGPGKVPPLRLRVTPVLPRPGEELTVELIRGPGYEGAVPAEVALTHLHGRAVAKVDEETRQARLTLDAKAEGWCELAAGGARALVFVRPPGELAVKVTPGRPRYAPGESAELAVTTEVAGKGAPAAVGLFGVDESLGQLAPLPGADDLSRVRPRVTTGAPAFGVLDGQALTLGRIRGANAAAATVLRVSAIPEPAELDAVLTGGAESPFDPVAELTDRFYDVLEELHAAVRRWEKGAPAGEKMRPERMAALWKEALAACAKRGARTDDAFGRELRLHRLPPDLLALTDPREVVTVGTRLPEDVESWPAWVGRVRP
jgi:hypothetical protein